MFLRRKASAETIRPELPTRSPIPLIPCAHLHDRAVTLATNETHHPVIIREYSRRSPVEQPLFMMAYGCFIIWVISVGLDRTWKSEEVRTTLRAVHAEFSLRPWFDAKIFKQIWKQTMIVMPAEELPGAYGGLVYPAADILLTATLAGYALDTEHEPEFGYHVSHTMTRLAEQAKALTINTVQNYADCA